MTIPFGFGLLFTIINIVAVVVTVLYISKINGKVMSGKFTLPLVLGLFWIVITSVLQFLLYNYFGQSPLAARASEIVGLICVVILGAHISHSDQVSPVWKFLLYIDRLAGGS